MSSSIERRFALAKSGLSREAEDLSKQEQQILMERFAKGALQSGASIKGARDVERDISSKQSSGFGRLAASQAEEEMQKKQSTAQRQFSRLENESKRQYASGESQASRAYQAGESAAIRQYTSGESQASRAYQAGESAAIRDFQAKEVSEARAARELEAQKIRDFTFDQKLLDNALTQQDIDIKKSELEINKVISMDNLRRASKEPKSIQDQAKDFLGKLITGDIITDRLPEKYKDYSRVASPDPRIGIEASKRIFKNLTKGKIF